MLLCLKKIIESVAELRGHSAISITQIYLHSSTNQKQNAVNKLDNLFKTKSGKIK